MPARKSKPYQLKKLAILAKQNVNAQLHLQRTKIVHYEEKQYFCLLLLISLFGAFAEGGGQMASWFGDLPKGDSLLDQLEKLNEEGIREQFRKIFEWQFKNIFRFRPIKPKVVLAIDTTDKPTYSKTRKEDPHICGGKHKAGTNYFYRYATVQIADKKNPITLYVMRCDDTTTNTEIIEALVFQARKLVRIKCVLIDRGFYDTTVFNKLEQLGVKYIMPCKSDKKTNAMFEEFLKSDYEVKPYFCQNKKREHADFKLIMISLRNGKEIGFVTNMNFIKLHRAEYYMKLYRRRWNIETGYRLQNMFLAKTCSLNPSVRLFYFCYAVSLHNLWVVMKRKLDNSNFHIPVLLFIFAMIVIIIAEYIDLSPFIDTG